MVKKGGKQDRTLSILAHILGLFTGFVGPLIILLASKDAETQKNSKIILNWQFSLLIYGVICTILVFILIGILGLIALGVLNTIFSIIGAVRASEGELWNYPLSIKFFKNI